mmetsp:Transcript_79065/g.118882  ORF Transcript_79065/g.118882 Transcript_79065/m.118882 type:complete len:240 (+) Transcript_79065:196-915(+)
MDSPNFDSSNRSNLEASGRSHYSESSGRGGGGGAPPARRMPPKTGSKFISNRDNSDFKWQRARGVVGALEVNCEPDFKYRDELLPRYTPNRELVFDDALRTWRDLKLRDSFVRACDGLPAATCCCGLLNDSDATIRDFVSLLNEGWVKGANKQLIEKGIKIDIFLWNWQNASGKAETNILLIRFFELSSYRLRRASRDESIEFDDLLSPEELSKVMEASEDSNDVDGDDGDENKKEMAR